MSVVIRLQRTGKRSQPQYRIVVAEKRSAVGSQAKEVLGTFNPCLKENEQIKLDTERLNHWVKVGAVPSKTMASLIKKASK
ncbi:MAG: 30S ribosomal protein S16 [Elusimicrobiaceae bacterium]|nr:30S ribosomal protein S16 [Elusimicrobiaceae bacterium]